MARVQQVIHVKDLDGTVRECALFDSASDIPSPATAREFGLNGAKIYGAVLDGGDISDDGTFLLGESGTELAFHDGPSSLRLLTTPYFVRPKTETLEFGADGGTVYLEDYSLKAETHEGILSTNGTLYNYSCDRDFISFVNAGSVRVPAWTVVCGANTSASERSFTLTLTYSFADGSTHDITFTGTQAAAEASEAYLYFERDTLTWDKADHTDDAIKVITNIDFTVESDSEWLKCYRENVYVELRADYNEGYERTGTVTATGIGYPLTARLTITQAGEKERPQIWFEDDETATEKTIELQTGGSAVTVAIGHSSGTEALELDSDWWGSVADGRLSVVLDGTEYYDYTNFAKVGSPMIGVSEPSDALSHPTRVLSLSATDYEAYGGNTLRIYINISD